MSKVKVIEKVKTPHWSKPALDYSRALKEAGKPISYFKMHSGRYNGKRQMVKFLRVHESGLIIYVDTVMFKIGVTSSLGTPFNLHNSTKQEFNSEMKKMITLLK